MSSLANRPSDRLIAILDVVLLVAAGIAVLAPVAWMVLSSFKESYEVTAYPPTIFFSPTLDNYRSLSETTPFLQFGINSLIVTIGSTALGILLGAQDEWGKGYAGEAIRAVSSFGFDQLGLRPVAAGPIR